MQGRIPSLDGFRGLAILLVLTGHGGDTFGLPPALMPYLGNGSGGVRIFFVLSGFLIYNLSVREISRTGTFSIADFYRRRALRIFPCFYLFLAVIAVLAGMGILRLSPAMVASAGTFTLNYFNATHEIVSHSDFDAVGHYWTLALEEQFYLTWPLLTLFARRGLLHRVLVGVMVAAPLLRIATCFFFPALGGKTVMMFHTGFDQIAGGVLLGELMQRENVKRRILAFAGNPLVALAAGIFLFVISPYLNGRAGPRYFLAAGISLEIACVCVLIVQAVCVRNTVFFRVLNWKPLAWIGVLSYSLYVWNNLFLEIGGHWFNAFPANFLMVIGLAVASHYLVENPFLRLKDRLHARRPAQPVAAPESGV